MTTDGCLELCLVVGPIAVDFPRLPGELTTLLSAPVLNGRVRLPQRIVATHVQCERDFASGSFGGVHIAGSIERAHYLDPEIHLHRRGSSLVMMIEEHIVAVSP